MFQNAEHHQEFSSNAGAVLCVIWVSLLGQGGHALHGSIWQCSLDTLGTVCSTKGFMSCFWGVHSSASFCSCLCRAQEHGNTAAERHALRYLEIGQGGKSHRFLQYFIGHTARVTKVALNPKNDTIISAAQVRHSYSLHMPWQTRTGSGREGA